MSTFQWMLEGQILWITRQCSTFYQIFDEQIGSSKSDGILGLSSFKYGLQDS